MNITLASQDKRYLESSVVTGRFGTVEEGIAEAIALLRKREKLVFSGSSEFSNLGFTGDGDIMALAFIVMMEAAKSAREDLKAIMQDVKAINKAKEAMRKVMGKMNRDIAASAGGTELKFAPDGIGGEAAYHRVPVPEPCPECPDLVRYIKTDLQKGRIVNGEQLKAAREVVKDKLDNLSEMGEMESLRLQMAMDRMSKTMSTLSNILKKISDTSQSISSNLK